MPSFWGVVGFFLVADICPGTTAPLCRLNKKRVHLCYIWTFNSGEHTLNTSNCARQLLSFRPIAYWPRVFLSRRMSHLKLNSSGNSECCDLEKKTPKKLGNYKNNTNVFVFQTKLQRYVKKNVSNDSLLVRLIFFLLFRLV